MAAAVQEHVALTHQDKGVLRAADSLVRILEAVRAGQPLRPAILVHASDWISAAKVAAWSQEADDTVIGRRLSPACYIPDAFPASLYLAWKYADDFGAGIIANARVGGDSCHRGAVVGALLGAANGVPARNGATASSGGDSQPLRRGREVRAGCRRKLARVRRLVIPFCHGNDRSSFVSDRRTGGQPCV